MPRTTLIWHWSSVSLFLSKYKLNLDKKAFKIIFYCKVDFFCLFALDSVKSLDWYQVKKQEYYLVCVSEFADLSRYQVSLVFFHFYSIYILLSDEWIRDQWGHGKSAEDLRKNPQRLKQTVHMTLNNSFLYVYTISNVRFL